MDVFSEDSSFADDVERSMVRCFARHRRLHSEIEEAARSAAARERLELQLARLSS
jgi:hypothetical protein